LERHVLEEMRDAVDLGRLVPRADIDPDAQRHRLDALHRVGEDAHAVLERGHAHRHAAPPFAAPLAWARTWFSTARRSLGSAVIRSGRDIRSARRGGSMGRRPVALSTASGNFAGWAQASDTIGEVRSCRAAWAAASATALCGSMSSPVERHVSAMVARVASSSTRCAVKSRRADCHSASLVGSVPVLRKAATASLTAAPLRPLSSNSRRSKLLDTWMSMLGERLGWTPSMVIIPLLMKRARMSLRLVPMTSSATG